MSAPAISSIVDELVAEGLVIEEGPGVSSGGRPPILLRFNARAWCLMGVEVRDDAVAGVLADLDGVPLVRATVTFREAGDLWRAIARLDEQLTNHSRPLPPLRGVGLAVPGIVDPETGHVVLSNRLGLRDEPLAPRLRQRFELPVVVENDVNAMLLAEVRWGAGRGCRHALLLHVGAGIGAGVMVDGRLYTGHAGHAGEVGYLVVDSGGGSHPRRGDRGSFEVRYSVPALCSRAGVRTPEELLEEAARENPRAAGVLADAERGLAAGIANMAALLAPERVICHGPLFRAGGGQFLSRLRRHVAALLPRPPEIVCGRLDSDAAALGAVARVLVEIGLEITAAHHVLAPGANG